MSRRIDIQPATVKKQLAEHPLRVAAYCRVSTDREEQLGSLENQKILGGTWHQDGHWENTVEYLHHRPDAKQREIH